MTITAGRLCQRGRHALEARDIGRRNNGKRFCIPCDLDRKDRYFRDTYGTCDICERRLRAYNPRQLCHRCLRQVEAMNHLYRALASGRGPKLKPDCIAGHPYDADNTFYYIDLRRPEVRRQCRACMRAANVRNRRKQKLVALRAVQGEVRSAVRGELLAA